MATLSDDRPWRRWFFAEKLRTHGAARVVLAVPVAPPGWQAGIGGDADEFVCVSTPPRFFAIGQFYASFPQVSDDEVSAYLRRAAAAQADAPRAADDAGSSVTPGH